MPVGAPCSNQKVVYKPVLALDYSGHGFELGRRNHRPLNLRCCPSPTSVKEIALDEESSQSTNLLSNGAEL